MSGSEPITPADWERIVRLPPQDRQSWKDELRAVTRAARERGDMRPPGDIIVAWLKFRADFESG